ncbi:PD-(D/E)XK nuclease family protein [bacterium]|nr:PD-(D/E)XK nuclease family protein [bacterium]
MLEQHLFLGTTRERCRDFVRDVEIPGLIHAYTLPEFVNTVFRNHGPNFRFRGPSALEKQRLLRSVIADADLNHFAYLQKAPDRFVNTLDILLNFFHLIRVNGLEISAFSYENPKRQDLEKIHEKYTLAMRNEDCVDYADMVDFVTDHIDTEVIAAYRTITIDRFENGEVNLCNSVKEKQLIQALTDSTSLHSEDSCNRPVTDRITFNRVFSRADEVAEAARIVRSLLNEGVAPEHIVIAAGSIDSFSGFLYETMGRYEIPLFISKGVQLKHIRVFGDVVRKLNRSTSYQEVHGYLRAGFGRFSGRTAPAERTIDLADQLNMAALKKIREVIRECEFLELTLDETADYFTRSVANEPVVIFNGGIPLQELNQLIFRDFRHLVLLGVDSGILPPAQSGNFLYQPCHLEEIFGQNNSYCLSRFHLEQVLLRSDNLHIITAGNDGGRPVEVAQVLLDLVPDLAKKAAYQVDPSALCRDDRLNNLQRVRLDENSEAFLNSVQNKQFTGFDGLLSDFRHTIPYLSASQLNTYATCPLKYFFNYVLGLRAPSDESAGFESFETGSMMHSVFERFSRDLKEKKYSLPETLNRSVREHLYKITGTVYRDMLRELGVQENIHHKMTFRSLVAGLKDDEDPGVIRKFLDAIYDPENEAHYLLQDLFDIEHDISKHKFSIGTIPVKGFIDRIDSNRRVIRLIDYKSTANPNESKIVKKMMEYREFQLPLYLLYAKDKLSSGTGKGIEAFLYSPYAEKEYARISWQDDRVSFHYREGREEVVTEIGDFLQSVGQQVSLINDSIRNGRFAFCLDEEGCEYCDFTTMCHKVVLGKEGGHGQI